ncbi:MAG: adenine deaminase [Candidatus Cloacimonetes bacterium]|nr:adenine deaminase [Candidatus Cloacimonadota bacterium]MBS3768215.1 adenine deaminase [Candidatus Cloacimonadota bacterium]
MKKFQSNILDVLNKSIFPGTLAVKNGRIVNINKTNEKFDTYIIPGFVDAHFHIESTMLVPSEYARIAASHGTIGAICDPHEIANVMGIEGVKFMLADAAKCPLKLYFSAPSCVPATEFETSGARLGPDKIEQLFKEFPLIKHLGEVMNFPGVIAGDPEVMQKIALAKKYNKQIDGHAPGLRGDELKKYVEAGITTDHESFTKEEALEKLALGMKIWIREGSAARNFAELISIANKHYDNCGFCSDDKHPDELIKGYIDDMVRRAVKTGLDPMKVLQMACVNPVQHYGLEVGLLQKGDTADFLIVDNLEQFHIIKTVINGEIVFADGKVTFPRHKTKIVNNFRTKCKNTNDFAVKKESGEQTLIEAIDGEVITKKGKGKPGCNNGNLISNPNQDILKIVVVNRYKNKKPAVAFAKNFGLKKGAIASSVAHDSHNVIAVGVSDEEITSAVNLIIENKGGVCAVSKEEGIAEILPLPVAGLMSNDSYERVTEKFQQVEEAVQKLGSHLNAPLMTLSFMALLVIPEIKLSDKGLFDSKKFEFINKL